MKMFVLVLLVIGSCGAVSNKQIAAGTIQAKVFGDSDVNFEEPMALRGKPLASGSGLFYAKLAKSNLKNAPGQTGKLYRPPTSDNVPIVDQCQDVKCHLTLVLVLDSSGSVGEDNFMKELEFAKTFLEILTVKALDQTEPPLKVCVGIVRYSNTPEVIVNPCCDNTLCSVLGVVKGIPYKSGSTNTAGALKVARQMLQATSNYRKVVMLITDGRSNTGGSPVSIAREMRKEDKIDIVGLGVTNSINEAELRAISGDDIVTKIDLFDDFHALAGLLLQANSIRSEDELSATIKEICSKEDGVLETCEEESIPDCDWGEWSKCVRVYTTDHGTYCRRSRTCKQGWEVVNREHKTCECKQNMLQVQVLVKQPFRKHKIAKLSKRFRRRHRF